MAEAVVQKAAQVVLEEMAAAEMAKVVVKDKVEQMVSVEAVEDVGMLRVVQVLVVLELLLYLLNYSKYYFPHTKHLN